MSEALSNIKDNFTSLPTWGKAILGVVAVGASTYFLLDYAFNRKRKSPFKADYKPNVVYLYQFPRASVIPSISPFALKLETWLRMADIFYENVKAPLGLRSKEGLMPFVELNGVEYCDSSFVIRDLTKLLKKDVDRDLSNEEKSVSRAFEQMIENSTFWSYGWLRYTEFFDELLSDKIFMPIPYIWRLLTPISLMKKQFRKKLYYHGIGRHSRDEIINIGVDDLKSISLYLGNKQYFHGDTPTTVDAFLFGVLGQILYIPITTPHQKLLKTEYQNLARYCDRIKDRFWPDWNEICATRSLNTQWKK